MGFEHCTAAEKVQIESEYIPGYDIFGDGYFFVLNE